MDMLRAIPRMFHRRLLLIAGVMAVTTLLLGAQLVRLTMVEGAARRRTVEHALQRTTLLPTYRGSIVDRHGRKLAVDRPGYALAVEYEVITGAWVRREARAAARSAVGRSAWRTLPDEAQAALVNRHLPAWEERAERLWEAISLHAGIAREDLALRLATIEDEVETLAERVWARQRQLELTAQGGDETRFQFRPRPIFEQTQAHVVVPRISDEVAFTFRTLAAELPDMFEVQEARRRVYPWTAARVLVPRDTLPRPLAASTPVDVRVHGVADHILGSMREVRREDVERRPLRVRPPGPVDLGGYHRVNDVAGERGLERAFEDTLRGTRGRLRRQLDSGEEARIPPGPGADLHLTLDILLQARVQAIMSDTIGLTIVQPYHHNSRLPEGWPLNGAAVVLEVESGEVLAMVSMPTLAMRTREGPDVDHAWINRPVDAIYPPGSIIKPLVLVAAAADGVYHLAEPITCEGHYFPERTRPRCWVYREAYGFLTHGPLLAEDAIARSCNIFFYTLADRLGMERLIEWYRRFGIGTPLGAGLRQRVVLEDGTDAIRGEAGGTLPSASSLAALSSRDLKFETLITGIGQGPVTWTPLHAANAFATLARGGIVRDATLVVDDPRGPRRRRTDDLALPSAVVDAALEGLRRSVMEHYGTGHHLSYAPGDEEEIFNAAGVTVWAKTGTAQAPPLRLQDTNEDGLVDGRDEGIADLDHAWFVGLVGPNDTARPMFAIAVIVEYGGSGGRVAGPIANQIIRALQEEGYLPPAPSPPPALGDGQGEGA